MTEQGIDKASSFEAARARLLALAYRMLGSRAEAEDVVQDVWLKWHLAQTQAVQTPAAWLTTLTTRTAIDRLRHAQRERSSQASGWLPEPWLDQVAPSAEELALRAADMSYGVMLLLEHLKPDERAAFVLHEAFDCDYAEIGSILERTPAACRQIVHRAKARLRRAGAPLERPDPVVHARIVERLRAALEAQDRTSLLRLFSSTPELISDAPLGASLVPPQVLPRHEPARTALHAPLEPSVKDPAGVSCSASLSAPSRTAAAASAHSGEPVGGPGWMGTIAALARQAGHAEVVSMAGALCIALCCDGDVVGVIDVLTDGATDESARIVSVRIVTSAARLQAANQLLGREAVRQLLARIRDQPGASASVAVSRDFPVDVDA
ncbi:sigma-70 family RNA polymerase sigma factor [Paraburkholderia sp. MMS20-SJTR3]|uniref:Sigma-70 family RNA polymerase sigma factor n=1 Tax=Paraburkholderia sejongensis TaxID=2886946 RepID=A0ABS8JW81_9BURK|nr:sigma-70 family RNA polymerase sigma factor [Paraburkholderia sp. MMS20-SJTR3]MCC8394162.1 sigma-70 family RNA polymerase sigma factor [Paraburkholderia sp. MMS20-SJTR3]